jgi:hypothetical protein
MPDPIRIGQLRWPVTLYQRKQTATPGESGITETPLNETPLHADIQPVGAMMFYGILNADPDQPVTHRIRMRWTDYLDFTNAIQRVTNRPDGTQRVETFRVRRIQEVEGRKRWVQIDVELETAQ